MMAYLIKPTYKGLIISLVLSFNFNICVGGESRESIYLQDNSQNAGIDFVHFAPRPRWCEIGPSIVGTATNEELSLVFQEEEEFWKSNGRLLTMDEFANIHLIKMNGSGGAWLDYDRDGDWDLYLVNCQGNDDITNALYENQGNGSFLRVHNSGAEDRGEGMAVSAAPELWTRRKLPLPWFSYRALVMSSFPWQFTR
jgi:hypothetical protein